jgi:hypothetical protein
MPSGTQKTEYTLFEPFGERRYLTKYIQSTPSILFRAHSPRASGVTTASYVASTAAVDRQGQNKPYDDDILTMDTEWARDALERHVTTWTREDNDNFVSWTSSPLFALQHAIRREATDRNPPSTARQVKLSILFTSKLPAGCFVPSVALLDAYDAHYNADMQRRYYHGEYLSQGRLDIPGGAMITITLEDLVASGLYRLYPGFELDKQRLCTRVARLRTIFLGQKHDVIPKEVRLARTIAEKCCSEAAFRYVLFASLLGLKSRNILDPGLQSVYSDLFHGRASSLGHHHVLARKLTEPSVGIDNRRDLHRSCRVFTGSTRAQPVRATDEPFPRTGEGAHTAVQVQVWTGSGARHYECFRQATK